jgi:hypothetical protein
MTVSRYAPLTTDETLRPAHSNLRHVFVVWLQPTYFLYEPTGYVQTGATDWRGAPYIRVTSFRPQVLPAFLEGLVRYFKVLPDVDARRALYHEARNSALYDRALGMYRICGPLESSPPEIGTSLPFVIRWNSVF